MQTRSTKLFDAVRRGKTELAKALMALIANCDIEKVKFNEGRLVLPNKFALISHYLYSSSLLVNCLSR